MATWNELFLEEKHIAVLPQPEVYKFIKKIEGSFEDSQLNIWDLCCGAGRHTVLVSKMGHATYGSDVSENGINHTKQRLKREGLSANLKISDMTKNPWSKLKFHGVICWDALHHNTIDNIKKSVDIVYYNMSSGGMFLLTLISSKASPNHYRGVEIEKSTFVREDGDEKGVPHHYFDEEEIRELFKKWEIVTLVEQVNTYIDVEPDFYKTNPFPYTKWGIIVKK